MQMCFHPKSAVNSNKEAQTAANDRQLKRVGIIVTRRDASVASASEMVNSTSAIFCLRGQNINVFVS